MQSKMKHECTCHLCVNKRYHLQLQVIFLHERRHELLTFPNRPLSHESCLVCRLIGRQCVHNIVLSECLADNKVQTMPGFSHFAKLSPCEMRMDGISIQTAQGGFSDCASTQQHTMSIYRNTKTCLLASKTHSCKLAYPLAIISAHGTVSHGVRRRQRKSK